MDDSEKKTLLERRMEKAGPFPKGSAILMLIGAAILALSLGYSKILVPWAVQHNAAVAAAASR